MEINVESNVGEGERGQNVENVTLFTDFVGVEVPFDWERPNRSDIYYHERQTVNKILHPIFLE